MDGDALKFNPSMPLKSYAVVYPIMLKIAILSRLPGSEDGKMAALLDWMYHSWLFSAAATIFAMQMFSSNRPKGAFKNIGSKERELILGGVENTTWDLVYVTEWFTRIKKQAERRELSVICSRDSSLIKTAELLRQSMFENREPSFLVDGFGKKIQERYDQYINDLDNKRRAMVPLPKNSAAYRENLVAALEKELVDGKG